MSEQEVEAFLAEQRVVTCATQGPRGWPHLMPLWYLPRGTELWAWTYGKSQKVRNLQRDPRATLQIETGEQYQELRGVMIEARTELISDTDRVAELGSELLSRYGGGASLDEGARAGIRAQAAKRVVLHFVPERLASWDHRKLGGVY